MLILPFKKTWTVAGVPTNLVSPDAMTIGIYDDTAASQVVAAGSAMLEHRTGPVRIRPQPGQPGPQIYGDLRHRLPGRDLRRAALRRLGPQTRRPSRPAPLTNSTATWPRRSPPRPRATTARP